MSDPEKFFPAFFDNIIVDAPCSGEGMFRKEPDMVKSWTPELLEFCKTQQAELLEYCAAMLKDGGMLLYSTCTFSVEENEGSNEYRIKEMIPVGIVHKTYIIAENSSGMYIIDQHAAAERINYEKVLNALLKDDYKIIDLLVPIRLEYSKDEFIKIKEHLDILKSIGISLDEFGDNTFIVRSHPTWFFEGYEREAIEKIIAITLEKGEFDKEKFIYKTASTMACKMSIKANDYLDLDTAKILLDNLRRCDNPFTCPHGRPTIITYSNYDLERLFKRAMN